MQDKFVDFIRTNNLVSENDRILLAVSGGIDSMVMLNLFLKAGFNVSAAHCNFSLRGEESDGDQQLVEFECEVNNVKLHRIKFETKSFAEEHKLSIQVSARNLRYNWFNKLCEEFGYTKLATAHNRDDVTETVILNLIRGTGLKGLSGIRLINGKIIRPLLFAGRDEITRYALQNSIKFREDSSNASVKYARNRVRHNVIPELEKLNPSAKRSIAETANHIHEAWNLVEDYLTNLKEKLVERTDDKVLISINGLKDEKFSKLFLFEELESYGFSHEIIEQVVVSMHGQPGKFFYSSSHQLLRDREYFILTKKKDTNRNVIMVDCDSISIDFPIKLNFRIVDNPDFFEIPRESSIAALDYDKLIFPLTLRPWQPGDRFIPIGMMGFKKVSDFLVDLKISLTDKEEIYVLESNNEIVWVVGYRIDERYKITRKTKCNWVVECF